MFHEQGRPVCAPSDDEEVNGHVGDTVLVTLTQRPHFHAAMRIYRFRILNGSNAASIAWLSRAAGSSPCVP